MVYNKGSSINHVIAFLPIFGPPPPPLVMFRDILVDSPLPMAGWLALLMAGWLAALLTFYLDCQARRWTWRRPPPAIG